MTHSPSRRTGTVTRPVRTGTGLLSAFVSVIAVMNSFGKPQGLPLIPETVSSPVVSTTDEYDDVLGRHHEDCISSLSPKEHWILFDSGAAAHCCLLDYAPDYPLLPVGKNPPKLRSVTGKPLNIIGRKPIRYDASDTALYVNYYVCDVPFCIVSVARMLLQDYCTLQGLDEATDTTTCFNRHHKTWHTVVSHSWLRTISLRYENRWRRNGSIHEHTGHRHV